jgi:hypothetical protein
MYSRRAISDEAEVSRSRYPIKSTAQKDKRLLRLGSLAIRQSKRTKESARESDCLLRSRLDVREVYNYFRRELATVRIVGHFAHVEDFISHGNAFANARHPRDADFPLFADMLHADFNFLSTHFFLRRFAGAWIVLLGTVRTFRASVRKLSNASRGLTSKSSTFGFMATAYHAAAVLSTAYAGKGSLADSVLPVSSEYMTRRPTTALATPTNRSPSFRLRSLKRYACSSRYRNR